MLQNLKRISKAAVPIRIGGTTSNHGIWVPNQKQAIIQNFATPGADQPANSTWGPSYLESFKVLPQGTQYTVGVTFDNRTKGAAATITEAEAFYSGLGDNLFAFEVGNEFDGTNLIAKLCGPQADFALLQHFQWIATRVLGVFRSMCQNGWIAQPLSRKTCSRKPTKRDSWLAFLLLQGQSTMTLRGRQRQLST